MFGDANKPLVVNCRTLKRDTSKGMDIQKDQQLLDYLLRSFLLDPTEDGNS